MDVGVLFVRKKTASAKTASFWVVYKKDKCMNRAFYFTMLKRNDSAGRESVLLRLEELKSCGKK